MYFNHIMCVIFDVDVESVQYLGTLTHVTGKLYNNRVHNYYFRGFRMKVWF